MKILNPNPHIIDESFFCLKKFASKLKEENCKAEIVTVMDGEEKEMHYSEKNTFNEFLSIKTKNVRLYARIDLIHHLLLFLNSNK